MTDKHLIICLSLSLIGAIFLACLFGSTSMPLGRLLISFLGQGSISDNIVLWEIRMPRALAAALVGAALGLSGAALQGLLRNPLAEPGILGVSGSAALGATLVLFYGAAQISPLVVPVAAICGALAATAILTLVTLRTSSVVTLILLGVGLSSFSGAIMALLLNLAPNPFTLSDLITWSLGSVANRSLTDISLSLPFLIAGSACVFSVRRELTALALGEETALTLGANLKKTRLLIVVGTGLLTGAAVSIAGAIGFVGIVAPHFIRSFVQYDPARTLLPAAMVGAIVLISADILVRLIPTPTELRLGVIAALIGAPAFVWIILMRRTGHE